MASATTASYDPSINSAGGPEERTENWVFQTVLIALTVLSLADFLLQAVVVLFVLVTLIAKNCCDVLKIIILIVFLFIRIVVGFTLIISIPLNIAWIFFPTSVLMWTTSS